MRNSKVDAYLSGAKKWREEMEKLREIILRCGLVEEVKWGKPCYTLEGKNVVLMIGFKEYCSLLFGKGALLKDDKKILVKAGENTQGARQMRFTSFEQVAKLEKVVKAYVLEAIAAEKAGLEVAYKKIEEFEVPEELQRALDKNAALKKAFKALTPGRQRGYIMHVAAAKQAKTREARVEKCVPLILAGKGLNEEYRAKRD